MIIMGIDPGTRRTGFGIIDWDGNISVVRQAGVIYLNEEDSLSVRLRHLHRELTLLFAAHHPDTAVVEKIFFGRNADSAFKLGHARGVCLLSAAESGAAVEEYAARWVKKSITGSGAAAKEHVRMVVTRELRYSPESNELDVSDALALALCYVQEVAIKQKMEKGFANTV